MSESSALSSHLSIDSDNDSCTECLEKLKPGVLSALTMNHVSRTVKDSFLDMKTYYREKIRVMKDAADYFRSTSQPKRAFPLYATVLNILFTLVDPPETEITWIVAACVTTASVPSHLETSKALLEKRLNELSEYTLPSEAFVYHRLLARIYHLMDRLEQYRSTRHIAYRCLRGTGVLEHSETTALPEPNLPPSLSLLFHFFLTSDEQHVILRGNHEYRAIPVSLEEKVMEQIQQPASSDLLYTPILEQARTSPWLEVVQKNLLYKKSGPFEVRNGIMENLCLPSCIAWCSLTLPRLLRDTDWLKLRRPYSDFADTVGHIFEMLWLKWKTEQQIVPEELSTWMTGAERSLGISACEILLSVVSMSIDVARSEDNQVEESTLLQTNPEALVALSCEGVQKLKRMGAESMANEFLVTFKKIRIREMSELYFRAFRKSHWKLQSSAKQAIDLDITEGISRPDHSASAFNQSNVTGASNHDKISTELPPLAPSLASSAGYSSFKALAIRAAKGSLDQKVESSKPSNAIRSNSMRDYAMEESSLFYKSLEAPTVGRSHCPSP